MQKFLKRNRKNTTVKSGGKQRLHPLLVFVFAFISTWAVTIVAALSLYSFFTVLIFGILFIAYSKHFPRVSFRDKDKLPFVLLSIILSIIVIFVNRQHYFSTYPGVLSTIIVFGVLFLGLFLLCCTTTIWLSSEFVMGHITGFLFADEDVSGRHSNRLVVWLESHAQLATFILCLLCWLPYYLYYFPGIAATDTIVQLNQILGETSPSDHHPFFHTALIALFVNLGFMFTSDINVALGFYTTAQMIFMAYCASVGIETLNKIHLRFGVKVFFVLCIALIPFNPLYVVTVWKDTPFAGVCMLLVCALAKLVINTYRSEKTKVSAWIQLAIICILFGLFRNNGLYALIIMTPFMVYVFRKQLAPVLLSICVALVACLVVKIPIYGALDITPSDFIESCSIPLQQVSRTVVAGGASAEQLEEIDRVMATEEISNQYKEHISDPMKHLVRDGNMEYLVNHKIDYLSLWLQMGIEHPGIYMDAWIAQVRGWLYPNSGWGWWVVTLETDENNIGLQRMSLLPEQIQPAIASAINNATSLYKKIPVYSMLWCVGTYSWLLFFCMALVLSKKRCKKRIIVLLVPFTILLTLLIATPVAYEFRYYYGVVFSAPVWLMISWAHFRQLE